MNLEELMQNEEFTAKLEKARDLDEVLEDYISCSPIIKALQLRLNESPHDPCDSCRFSDNCIPCAAINSKLEGTLDRGFKKCPVYEARD